MIKNGFVQFNDGNATVTVALSAICVRRENGKNLAFYGSKGRSVISDNLYSEIMSELGLTGITISDNDSDDDGDDDLTVGF